MRRTPMQLDLQLCVFMLMVSLSSYQDAVLVGMATSAVLPVRLVVSRTTVIM